MMNSLLLLMLGAIIRGHDTYSPHVPQRLTAKRSARAPVTTYSAATAIGAPCTPRTSLPGFAPVDLPSRNVSVPATNVWR